MEKNHAFPAEIMLKIMNHTKIGKIMKNHEILPVWTPEYQKTFVSLLYVVFADGKTLTGQENNNSNI